MIIEPTLPDHWKVKQLKRISARPEALEWVIRFWLSCQTRKSASFDANRPALIASICCYDGDPDEFVGWLIECEFLDVRGSELVAHDWAKLNSKLVANWKSGQSGGRPGKSKRNPMPGQGINDGSNCETQTDIGLTESEVGLTKTELGSSGKVRIGMDREEEAVRTSSSNEKKTASCVRAPVAATTGSVPGYPTEGSAAPATRNPQAFFLEKENGESDAAASALIVRLSSELGSRRSCKQIAG